MRKTPRRRRFLFWMAALPLFATLLYAGARAQPQFTGNCAYSHSNPGDPIALPPPERAHVHDFFGNDTTDQQSTTDSLLADPLFLERDPTRDQCDRASNKTAYWVPRLAWGGKEILPIASGVYYQGAKGLDPRKTLVTPLGMEIIAFSPSSDKPEGSKARLFWHCTQNLNVAQSLSRGTPDPPMTCPDDPNKTGDFATLGVTIQFPACWDGGPFDVPDGASMRFPVRGPDGKTRCPSTHPKQLPQLYMLVDYTLPTKTGGITVAGPNGPDQPPSAMHADVHNAEDHTLLVEECIIGGADRSTPDFCRHGGGQVNRLTPLAN